jgi:hypothetical protein
MIGSDKPELTEMEGIYIYYSLASLSRKSSAYENGLSHSCGCELTEDEEGEGGEGKRGDVEVEHAGGINPTWQISRLQHVFAFKSCNFIKAPLTFTRFAPSGSCALISRHRKHRT